MSAFNDTFLKACRQEPTDYIPVWFMRQAGRSLPGYRKLREKYGVIELAQTPELAAQVSMEPVKLLGVDAAILFADITIFVLSLLVGLEVITKVPATLHTPLMSGSNAIHGVVVVGVMVLAATVDTPLGYGVLLVGGGLRGNECRRWIRRHRSDARDVPRPPLDRERNPGPA